MDSFYVKSGRLEHEAILGRDENLALARFESGSSKAQFREAKRLCIVYTLQTTAQATYDDTSHYFCLSLSLSMLF